MFFIKILNWVHSLLDVKCVYLYGDRDIYIRQPEDYVVSGKSILYQKLNLTIYELHQADRCCYKDLHKLIINGFRKVPRLR